MVQPNAVSVSTLNTLRDNALVRIAAGIGTLVFLSGCTNQSQTNTEIKHSPSVIANIPPSPTEEIKPTIVKTPTVDHEHTGISTVNKAIELLSKTPPINLDGTDADFQALIDAAKGDLTQLNLLGVTIEDVSANYELNKLYLEKTSKLKDELQSEATAWRETHSDGFGPLSTIEDTKAVNYLLGEILLQYQSGNISLPSKEYRCPEPNSKNITLSPGVDSSVLLPPLGIFRYSATTDPEICNNIGDTSQSVVQFYVSIPKITAELATKAHLRATAEAFEIESAIATLSDKDAANIIGQTY